VAGGRVWPHAQKMTNLWPLMVAVTTGQHVGLVPGATGAEEITTPVKSVLLTQ
jgi:hypothetical protein